MTSEQTYNVVDSTGSKQAIIWSIFVLLVTSLFLISSLSNHIINSDYGKTIFIDLRGQCLMKNNRNDDHNIVMLQKQNTVSEPKI